MEEAMLRYQEMTDSLCVEYIKRHGRYSMAANHFHPTYEVYYLLKGERIYFIRDSSYAVQPGDLVFLPRDALHKTIHSGIPSHERMVIYFDERFLYEAGGQDAQLLLSPFRHRQPVLRLPEEQKNEAEKLVLRLLEEIGRREPGYDLSVRNIVTDLLLLSGRFLLRNEPPETAYASPMHKKISEVIRYLNSHYAEPVTLAKLSETFFVSPYYLSRSFKEVSGFALTDYLNLTRIKEAQRLLRSTRLPVTEIAARVGFESFSHFGKMFKKISRVSARTYRKQASAQPGTDPYLQGGDDLDKMDTGTLL